jgi:3-deoxy-D-manno-octulosonate 8-phosphate phosphatase (KDO 8-P phosphatase)
MSVRLFALDVDGVLTDGKVFYTANGEELKAFHTQDGLGLKLLQKLGVELAVISGRESAPLSKRLDDLGIYHRRLKCKDKVPALKDICDELGITLKDVAFMGDDLIDLEAMEACAYAIAPANAVDSVRVVADLVTKKSGGEGAVREACEHLALRMGHNLEAVARGTKRTLVQ